jgi:hypothetical protein
MAEKMDYTVFKNVLSVENARLVNYLLYGGIGVGKTFFARTCATPLVVDCFDPGGYQSLIQPGKDPNNPPLELNSNLMVFDFSDENPTAPTQYLNWVESMQNRITKGFFNHVGTYMLDSLTTFSSAIMNRVMQQNQKLHDPRAIQEKSEYGPAQNYMMSALRIILSLPCHVIVTAHESVDKDELKGSIITRTPALIGKQRTAIPLLFSEIYRMTAEVSDKGFKNVIQTAPCLQNQARTRIGGGIYDAFEEGTMRDLLKRVGIVLTNKPNFNDEV